MVTATKHEDEVIHGRRWELVEFEWDEVTGLATYIYRNRRTDAEVSLTMQHEAGVAKSNWKRGAR